MNASPEIVPRDVSVIVPHYGDPKHADALIAQLRDQDCGADLEIIVVDDASPIPFAPRAGVRVFRREINGGFGSAVNSGVALATRSQLMILNSDLELPAGCISAWLREATPWQPAVTAPALVDELGAPQWSARHFPRTGHYAMEWLRPLARWRHTSRLHEAVGHDTRCVPGQTELTDWLVGAALLVPAAAYREAGGLDERYFMYCEETDLQRRLHERGVPAVYLGRVRVAHEGGASTDATKRLGWLYSSRFFYARKWGTQPGVLRAALIAASLVNFAFAGARRLMGRAEQPGATLRRELALIQNSAAEAKRRSLHATGASS